MDGGAEVRGTEAKVGEVTEVSERQSEWGIEDDDDDEGSICR